MTLRLGGLLLLSLVTAAQADTLTLRIRADGGQIQFFKGHKKLNDAQLNQVCGAARARKDEIVFDREKMTRDDALSAILKEAQCLGATHTGAITREPEHQSAIHKSEARKRAKPRHTAKARR